MAPTRKYSENPAPEEYQIPYDYVNFRKWCINTQAMTESTANSYISSIRTAFKELFDENDALFKNVRNGLKLVPSKLRKPEDWFIFMERQMDRLIEYTGAIEKYGDIKLESRRKDSFELVDSPKKMWVLAFQTYCRFVRWRIDGFRKIYGLETPVPKEKFLYVELPAKRHFEYYLKNLGKGYTKSSIESYTSRLKKLYNILIRPNVQRDYMEEATYLLLYRPEIILPIMEFGKYIEKENDNRLHSEISDEDLQKGMGAFTLYLDFLEDYMIKPEKYLKFPCNTIYPININ